MFVAVSQPEASFNSPFKQNCCRALKQAGLLAFLVRHFHLLCTIFVVSTRWPRKQLKIKEIQSGIQRSIPQGIQSGIRLRSRHPSQGSHKSETVCFLCTNNHSLYYSYVL